MSRVLKTHMIRGVTRGGPGRAVLRALAVRAFTQGFADGADPRRAVRRHAVDPHTHDQWRKGFEAGRDAIVAAERAYGSSLLVRRVGPQRVPRAKDKRAGGVVQERSR